MNPKRRVAVIDNQNGLSIRCVASEHRFTPRLRAAQERMRTAIDCQECVGARRSRIEAVTAGGKFKRERRRTYRYARRNLIGARVQNEDVAAWRADSPYLGSRGMRAQARERGPHRYVRHGAKSNEVNDADITVSRSDVGVESEAWPEERRSMLAGQESDGADQEANR